MPCILKKQNTTVDSTQTQDDLDITIDMIYTGLVAMKKTRTEDKIQDSFSLKAPITAEIVRSSK